MSPLISKKHLIRSFVNLIISSAINHMRINKELSFVTLFSYYVVFYLAWCLNIFFLWPLLTPIFGDSVIFVIIKEAIKLLIWTAPAIYLILHFKEYMWISLKEMLTSRVKLMSLTPVFAVLLLYAVAVIYTSGGGFKISRDFKISSLIGAVLFVGITEEIVFRGWILNAALKKYNKWVCIIFNMVLFLLIHFPGWIYKGSFFEMPALFFNCFGILVLGYIFSYTFIKTRNILVPITLHMFWNLLMKLFLAA